MTGHKLSLLQLASYKSTLRNITPSLPAYWQTVAALLNYQSLLLQLAGRAPDPRKIAEDCFPDFGKTGKMEMADSSFDGCVLDLNDHFRLDNVTLINSVVRYSGGPIDVHHLYLVNCYFEVNLSEDQHVPAPTFLLALLDADTQTSVRLE